MEFKRYFEGLLAYHRWAMQRTLEPLVVNELERSPEHDLFLHICAADLNWAERVDGKSPTFPLWGIAKPLSETAAYSDEAHLRLADALGSLTEQRIHEVTEFEDRRGNPHSNVIRDIFAHVFNHATHHRGQINHQLRRRGLRPPATDFMYYVRVQGNASSARGTNRM